MRYPRIMELFRFSVRLTFFIALFSWSDGVPPRKCICNNNVCKAAFKFSSDFQTSKQLCQEMGGQLITVPSEAASDLVRDLLIALDGDFWIGLRLPDLECTNDVSPLRGYIWTSGSPTTEFTNWRSEETVCNSSCVSISADLKWTEKSCRVQSDGLLCENVPGDVCNGFNFEEPMHSVFYNDTYGCQSAPCEHRCVEETNGFRCKCLPNYVISKKDQKQCVYKCNSESCAAPCVGTGSCTCLDGYILQDDSARKKICMDINECEQVSCDHHCFNTLGDYECSCKNGFRLVGKDKCVKSDESGPVDLSNSVIHTPSVNYTTAHASAGAPGKVIGVILFILVGIVAVMFFVRYWKQKMDGPNINSTSDGDCMQSSYS